MKRIIFILSLLFVINSNAQNEEIDFEIPRGFFKQMFRSPSDQYLVAWTGGVSTIVKNQSGQEIQIDGVIQIVEDYLNAELNKLDRRQFKFNLNTPKRRITTPDGKKWVARCGYNPYEGISYNDIMNGVLVGWPPEITTEVWALNVSKKTLKQGSYRNNKTGKIELISIYFHANSTFYYHKNKPQSLKGKITRDDDYKACGTILMNRLGPGYPEFKAETEVKGGEFEFTNQLFLGDYQVQYLWEDGTYQELDDHVVYDPFGVLPEEFEYELETFIGKINGTLLDEESKEPIKNQEVTLKPICEESELPEQETTTDEDGEFEFIDVPKGVYNIITEGAPETLAGLTKTPLRVGEILVKKNAKYDIVLIYTAPGFARAKLVWKNTKIRFPEDGEEIQFLDINAYKNSGATEHPNGTDGKPLDIPYSMIIPGIGKQTLYGWPESETATPEVLFVASLGGKGVYTKFKVNLAEDALNNCNISQIGNGPIYLDLGFDLFGKYPDDGGWQQENVYCLEDKEVAVTGGTYSAFPIHFKQHKFSTQEIEKFKNSEEFDVTLSNGKATLKIEFKISE